MFEYENENSIKSKFGKQVFDLFKEGKIFFGNSLIPIESNELRKNNIKHLEKCLNQKGENENE